MNDNPRILCLDIETKLIDIRAFGIRDQFIALHQIRSIPQSARTIHCVGWKWVGEKKTGVLSEWKHGYRGMLEGIRDLLDQADAVLGFNHENFDMKKLRGQFALEALDFPKPPTNIDIYRTVKQWGFPSSKLDYIAQAFGIGRKVKHPGYEMWDATLDGCEKFQRKMEKYCAGDVRLTEDVYHRLRPYIDRHPYLGSQTGYSCSNCGSKHLTSQGEKRTQHWRIQSLKCADCGKWRQGLRKKIA